VGANLDHIRSHYEALNMGDVDLIASHFTDDAFHYYTRLGPHEGARAIAENARWGVQQIDGQWFMEGGIEQGDEACIEWTMTWRDPSPTRIAADSAAATARQRITGLLLARTGALRVATSGRRCGPRRSAPNG
jgi:SnoaL-like domain